MDNLQYKDSFCLFFLSIFTFRSIFIWKIEKDSERLTVQITSFTKHNNWLKIVSIEILHNKCQHVWFSKTIAFEIFSFDLLGLSIKYTYVSKQLLHHLNEKIELFRYISSNWISLGINAHALIFFPIWFSNYQIDKYNPLGNQSTPSKRVFFSQSVDYTLIICLWFP